MSLGKLQEIAKDREAWCAAVTECQRAGYDLVNNSYTPLKPKSCFFFFVFVSAQLSSYQFLETLNILEITDNNRKRKISGDIYLFIYFMFPNNTPSVIIAL